MAVLISVTEGDVTQIVLADVGVQGATGPSSPASGTPFTPYGNIAATNVQTAIQELDDEKFGKAGGTVTGNLEIGTGGTLSFEGATADGFETTLAVVDPTADRTLTLPNITGTFVTTGDTGTVTSTMLLDGTILNADVNASAAIAGTKISPDFGSQTIVTTGVHSAAAGSAAAPSITFTGDLDTGIYSPGANQVAISTSGTGRLTVGTTAVSSTLAVDHPLGAVGTPSITFTGDLNTGFWSPSADAIAASTGGSERLRIDNSGRLLVGTSTVPTFRIANDDRTDSTHIITKSGTALGASFAVVQWAGNTTGSWGNDVVLAKSFSGTVGTHTIGSSNSLVSRLFFSASDGTKFVPAASIETFIDGTPDTNDMPGRLVFSTTADGAAGPTERMRIDNAGRVLVGTATANTSGAKLQTSDGLTFPAPQVASADANTLDDYEEGTFTPAISTGAGGPVVLSTATGQYTKTGNVVNFRLRITVSNANSASDFTRITGLPFVPSSAITTRTAVACGSIDSVTGSTPDNIGATYIANGTTEIRLFTSTGGNIVLTNTSSMDFNGTYFA